MKKITFSSKQLLMKNITFLLLTLCLFFNSYSHAQVETEPNNSSNESGVQTISRVTTITGEVGLSDDYDDWIIPDGSSGTLVADFISSPNFYVGLLTFSDSNRSSQISAATLSSGVSVNLISSNFYTINVGHSINPLFGPPSVEYSIELSGTVLPPCLAPTAQATTAVFGSETSSTLNLTSFTVPAGGADGYVVKMNTSNSFTTPTDGALPSASLAFGGGEQVVYAGTSASPNITVTGLSASTTYHFQVYAYNNCSGTETYETTGLNASDATAAPSCPAPTAQATNAFFGTETSSTLTLNSFTAPAGGATGYAVYINDSNSFTAPTDGSEPTADLSWNNSGQQAVFFGVSLIPFGSSVTLGSLLITGLDAGTTYYFQVYAYNNCSGTETYETTGLNASDATAAPADTTAPVFENSRPSSASITETGFTLNTDIDEAGTIYYVVVADGATAPTSAEVKVGTASSGGAAVTNGNAAVSTGGFTNAFSVTGLTANTAYDVYVVAEDDEGTPNLQASPTKIDVTTLKPLAAIVITEIMYNPAETGADPTEYIELYNAGSSVVDLTGYTFTQGVAHTFTGGSINPGEYFVITINITELDNRYGAGTADAQWTSGGLSNSGEDIELTDDVSRVVDYVDYDDNAPWPTETDGDGPSIRLNDVTSDNSLASNWSASTESIGIIVNTKEVKGTPGAAAVFDTGAPAFENSTPRVSLIAQTSFTLNTDINEAGTIYYVVLANEAIAPTSAEVKAGTASAGGAVVTSGNATAAAGGFTNDFSITGLTINTAYDVYVVAEDDVSSPNLQASPVKVDVTTVNAAPTFTSTPITSIEEGNTYTYTITTDDADGDNVAITGTTLPSWLSVSTTAGGEVTTLAGSGTQGFADGTGTSALFNNPYGVAVDALGNVYVADSYNHRIRKITPSGVVSTLAGSGAQDFADGTGTSAKFSFPNGVAVDASGNVYVADAGNHRIRKITPSGVVSTLAGSGAQDFADGTGTSARFNTPYGVAVDASGNVYVADFGNTRIRKITPSGVVSTLAGSTYGFIDGVGTSAKFSYPYGVAVDASENVYVADALNNSIRKITPSGVVSTLAGSLASGTADGTGTSALFSNPLGVAVDALGNVYVADANNHRIRKITPLGVVSTLAGSTYGFADGTGTSAEFNIPYGVAVDASGNVYVSDSNNHRIRKITGPSTILTGDSTGNAGDHNIVLEANDGNGGTVQQSFTVTVVPEPAVTLSVDNSTIDENAGTATLTATLSNTWSKDVTVTLGYTGTATNGTDYNSSAGTSIVITAGTTSNTASPIVTSSDDTTPEGDETIIVDITNVTNGTEATAQTQTITITDDDTPDITFTSAASSGEESVSSAGITVDLSIVSLLTVTADYAVTGTAANGTDYTLASGTLTFAPSETQKTITIASIIDDSLDENDETVIVTLSSPTNAGLGTNTIHTYTINDDDASPMIGFVTSSSNGDESAASTTLSVALTGQSGRDIMLDYTVTGTATGSGTDYTLANGTFTIEKGLTNKNFTIPGIVDDALDEDDETIIVTLSNPVNAILPVSFAVHTYTINDNDATPTIAFDATTSSGAESTESANLPVSLSAVSGRDVTVNYTVTGTATGSGTDYTLADGTLTINAGSLTNNISIASIIDDSLDENDETVIVTLSSPTNAGLGTNTIHTYTINDDDASPMIGFVTSSSNGDESAASTTLSVALTGQSGRDIMLDYTVTGTATGSGTDYTLANGTFTIEKGLTNKNFTIPGIVDDALDEDDETIIVTLSNPVNAILPVSFAVHTYTINDNDNTPTVAFGLATNSQLESEPSQDVQVSLSAVSGRTVTVDYAVTGTATAGGTDHTNINGTFTFNPGDQDLQHQIVGIVDDLLDEENETIILTLSNPTNVVLGTQTIYTYTITDNDDPPTVTLSVDNSSIDEASGTATLTATLSAVSAKDVTVTIGYSGTALNGTDYNSTASTTITINAGSLSANASTIITPINDTNPEGNETIIAEITGVANGTENGDQTLEITLVDDDLIPAEITFEDIEKTYGDADFSLGATSNSTGTISYSIVAGGTGSASLSVTNNETVNIGDAGTVTIRATLPADGIYDSATKDITLTISKAILVVTANSQTTTYGDNFSIGFEYGAFKNGDDASVLDIVAFVFIVEPAPYNAGTYTVRPDALSDNNYTPSYIDGTLTINKATLTVTADDQSKTYGDANPSFTVSYSGFKNNEDSSVLDTEPTASSIAVNNTNAGTSSITVSGGSDNNYTYNNVDGTLTITQRPITVTADDKTKERTTADPVFTYMVTNGDLVTGDAFTGDLTRDAGEASGTYAITQGTLTAGANYDLTFVSGTLRIEDTIAPNPPTITHISDYTCTGDTSLTGDNTLEISGTAEEGSTVEVFIEGISVGTVVAGSNGFFTYDHTNTTLADGTYNITAQATDIAGNTGTVSTTFTITINSVDTDNDGLPDVCDDDYDGNGVTDTDEDCDNDGIVDHLDTDNSACATAIQEVKSFGFSPNGDGVNDGWTIENITAYPNSVVQVYSRSGKLVFKKKGYQNDWDGVSNQINSSGKKLPVGPYLFIIDLGDGSKPTRGWIYINY